MLEKCSFKLMKQQGGRGSTTGFKQVSMNSKGSGMGGKATTEPSVKAGTTQA